MNTVGSFQSLFPSELVCPIKVLFLMGHSTSTAKVIESIKISYFRKE